MVYITRELDSHPDTFFCSYNCIVMHFTGNEFDVAPYTGAYEAIKAVPIVQAATAYENPETGKTTILILDKAIWMGEIMDHTLVKPNQLRTYRMTIQDNHFSEAPIFVPKRIMHSFFCCIPKGLYLESPQEPPHKKEIQLCSHVTCSLVHKWDTQKVRFPKSSCTVEEEISRII